ncbi:MAG: hypothetical protein SCM57_04700, partial [Bacillota bacterium]|nr:hypothetical protein [Bacillota bacterium]
DMADSNIENCLSCHAVYPFTGSNGPFEDVHARKLKFGGDHSYNTCDSCHDYITYSADCSQCHGGYDFAYAPHGSTPAIEYGPRNQDLYFPLRVIKNREMWDCIVCHQPGSKILAYDGQPYPTRPVQHHDIPELHKAAESQCSACHARSLTREHARPERLTSLGAVIGCNTCHQGSDTTVVNAITTKQKDCNQCHQNAVVGTVHAEKHETGLQGKCAECHGMNMMNETQYHSGDCYICHVTEDPTVQDAVLRQSEHCFDCHSQPHGVIMTEVRGDIPLYGGVTWGVPQEASLWAEETWLPYELKNDASKIIFSNRVNLDMEHAYQFYTDAMLQSGWTLLGSQYEQASYFELSYQKERRYATVWLFNGSVPNTSGNLGARIQIAYH